MYWAYNFETLLIKWVVVLQSMISDIAVGRAGKRTDRAARYPFMLSNACAMVTKVKPKQAGTCGWGKLAYVKSLICNNIKCYRTNSIYLLSRLYAILL